MKKSAFVKKISISISQEKEPTTSSEEKSSDKSDDPIRMYLREMGGVELLQEKARLRLQKELKQEKT